ncbi:hypothetical protein ABL78_0895 [Leptomonas seymouri]|uniref:diacylglycerol O-acyltransferase n=1 Tax=Leptomonas seymouri TaxID=5684 RepID=A0A0N1PE36_LEPSE|nr:hypothetical protein ABL78_0895 [Leptomonas seymouri]|eukprot:KPI90035.1 hypothetical protein ABL78_0895 [Leptomonas seymouri]
MDGAQLQCRRRAGSSLTLHGGAEERSVSPQSRSEAGKAAREACTLPSPAPLSNERVIIKNPACASMGTHTASTNHCLANEVSIRSGGWHSRISTGQTSSQASEPPLTHALPPASPDEVDEQLDRILYAVSQLQQLQQRGRYIAAREVRHLRRAFLFAVGEEQLYREAVQAEAAGTSETSAASSTSTTPSLTFKKAPHAHCSTKKSRKAGSVAPACAAGTPERPSGVSSAPHDEHQNEKSTNGVVLGGDAPASSDPAWREAADPLVGTASNPAQCQKAGAGTVEYSPKAAVADRLLTALEQYVSMTPTSSSFDVNGARFSWRSIIHTPGERRLQSLVMSLFIFFTGIPICIFISVLLLFFRYTAPLMLLYILWMFTFGRPRHPHRKSRYFARFPLWRYYRDYFPIRLVVPKPVRRMVDRERNYFFVYHPHGIHTFGALINFGLDTNDLCDLLPGITVHLQTLKVNLFVPFWRQLAIWMGCGDASASCIRKTLRSGPGQSVMLVVGGAEESLMAKPNANDLLLHKRKGFIKIALQEGTPLVPVYGFGENNVYNVADLASEPEVQHLLGLLKRYLGFAIPLVKGRGFFNFSYGILPHRRPIVVVVGEPIEVPRIAKPTAQDLDEWQAKYIEGLQKLYDEHRGVYDLEATGLRIVR